MSSKTELKHYRLLVAKAYFDKGWGLTGYLKYAIALFGLSSLNVRTTMIAGIIYGVSCYFIGRFWYTYRLIDTENEIQNRFNPFQREMREWKDLNNIIPRKKHGK